MRTETTEGRSRSTAASKWPWTYHSGPKLIRVIGRSLSPVLGCGTRCQLRCVWRTIICALCVHWRQICFIESVACSHYFVFRRRVPTVLLTHLLFCRSCEIPWHFAGSLPAKFCWLSAPPPCRDAGGGQSPLTFFQGRDASAMLVIIWCTFSSRRCPLRLGVCLHFF